MSTGRTCAHCGGPLDEGSLFCGTCGRSTSSAPRAAGPVAASAPALVEPPEAERVRAPSASTAFRAAPRPVPTPAKPTVPADASAGAPDPTTVPGPRHPSAEDPSPPHEAEAAPAPAPVPLLPVPGLPDARSRTVGTEASAHPEGPVDVEKTVVTGASAPRFVLQFSTGESVTVRGEGLIGRSPTREPGEAVDQLIPLADAGRSISKTHVAFGQDRGRFWVSDRYSTNGTVVRPPDEPARRCEPGRRYLVSRGTRVDIGDQFFVVS